MAKVIFLPTLASGGAERVAVNPLKSVGFNYLILIGDREIAQELPLSKEKILSLSSPPSQSLLKKFLNLPIRYIRLKKKPPF